MLLLIRFYRLLLSPALHLFFGPGMGCRFSPTCGEYAEEAVRRLGAVRGVGLTLSRLVRCHPGCQGGYDPVPEQVSVFVKGTGFE